MRFVIVMVLHTPKGKEPCPSVLPTVYRTRKAADVGLAGKRATSRPTDTFHYYISPLHEEHEAE